MKSILKGISGKFRPHQEHQPEGYQYPAESIFAQGEIESFFDLNSTEAIREGNIRGPVRRWTIKGDVRCGKYTSINGFFNARGQVYIGNYCAIGQYVALISGNHRTDMPNQQIWLSQRFGFKVPAESKGAIEVGHNVWIGDKANILSGVRIGHGAVVAASATVTKSVRPFDVVAGSPARVVKSRFSKEIASQLLQIRWWHWPDAVIARNREFFETALSHVDDFDLKSIINK